MCRVGDDDLPALLALAPSREVGAEEQQARELALAAGGGLQRDGVEPGHLEEDLLQLPLELERPLGCGVIGQRMQVREAGQPGEPLVDPRVVFHGAAAERIEPGVDPEVARRELGEVAQHLGLGELGQARRLGSAQLGRDLRDREPGRGDADPATARLRLLVDQLHGASASTSRSISPTVRFSVTATSSASSSPA